MTGRRTAHVRYRFVADDLRGAADLEGWCTVTGRHRAALYLAQAIIWAAVIIGSAITLDGEAFDKILPILVGGAAASVIVLPAALTRSGRHDPSGDGDVR